MSSDDKVIPAPAISEIVLKTGRFNEIKKLAF
jgi:hypothetical protein